MRHTIFMTSTLSTKQCSHYSTHPQLIMPLLQHVSRTIQEE